MIFIYFCFAFGCVLVVVCVLFVACCLLGLGCFFGLLVGEFGGSGFGLCGFLHWFCVVYFLGVYDCFVFVFFFGLWRAFVLFFGCCWFVVCVFLFDWFGVG